MMKNILFGIIFFIIFLFIVKSEVCEIEYCGQKFTYDCGPLKCLKCWRTAPSCCNTVPLPACVCGNLILSPEYVKDCPKTIDAEIKLKINTQVEKIKYKLISPSKKTMCKGELEKKNEIVSIHCYFGVENREYEGEYRLIIDAYYNGMTDSTDTFSFLQVKCSEVPECIGRFEFPNRDVKENISISLSCEEGKVCVYKIKDAFVCDNTGKLSQNVSSFYCIDKKKPYYRKIIFQPELIANNTDNTFEPFPNYYFEGEAKISLYPSKIVIDKEFLNFTIEATDKYDGKELSGIKISIMNFTLSPHNFSKSFPVKPCPEGGEPIIHSVKFSNLSVGWGKLISTIIDQAGNSNFSYFSIYVFLGARGDQQNQRSTDKIVLLKTLWDSTEEIKSKTGNLGGNYFKKIDCFGYRNKCTLIRDIIGKTDEFTDCLWIGPGPRDVKIYNFGEGVNLEKNEKFQNVTTCRNPNYCNSIENSLIFIWPNINSKIAVCSKNDTGILVDLPTLVSESIPEGFQIVSSTEGRFSVMWQVKYAREQRVVAAECYLNPTIDGKNACTIDDIINGNCDIKTGQQCKCSEGFPCYQDTNYYTIHSCSVENPRYFTGINRIICKFYDPKDLGVRTEVWYNHEFYYNKGKVYKNFDLIKFVLLPIEILKFFFNL